jgi:RNA polymerase sigma factor (sigma-70 family)
MIDLKEIEQEYERYRRSEEELQAIHDRFVSGDQSARQTLIESCLPLAIEVVREHVREFRELAIHTDDFVSSAFHAVILAVDKLPGQECTSVAPFIKKFVAWQLKDTPVRCLRVSRSTARRNGDKQTRMFVRDWEHIDRIDGQCESLADLEFREWFTQQGNDETERRVLDLVWQGYSQQEIGDLTGRSRDAIGRMVRRLRNKMAGKLNEVLK